MKLINDGELFKAKEKKFAETIVFVPFFFGKKHQLKRHVEFVNSLGFDCISFNLSDNLPFTIPKFIKNIKNGWGIKHLWAQEITQILNTVDGKKIIYSFSNPTSSALEAIALRKTKDIIAMVCDGGPFYDLLKCNWNFFNFEVPMKNIFSKTAANIFARAIWSINHEKEIFQALSALPRNFPILSIRGWSDPLVPPTSIDKAFAGHDQIDLEILNIPQGKHLDGLKNFAETYKPRVAEFLKSVATPI